MTARKLAPNGLGPEAFRGCSPAGRGSAHLEVPVLGGPRDLGLVLVGSAYDLSELFDRIAALSPIVKIVAWQDGELGTLAIGARRPPAACGREVVGLLEERDA